MLLQHSRLFLYSCNNYFAFSSQNFTGLTPTEIAIGSFVYITLSLLSSGI
nr:MAG TPA: hypothetical protein [Caudoviricetes sp.]